MSVLILKSRRFWVLYLAAASIAALTAFQLMFNSMPVLKVDIDFSRAEALAAAAQLQQKQASPYSHYQSKEQQDKE